MITFRQFIEADMAGAPSAGNTPPTPGSDPNKSHDDLNVLGRELDIDPATLNQALTGNPVLSFSPLHRKGKDKGSGPQIIIPDKIKKSGSVDGRLMQGNMQKLQNPNGSKGQGPQIDKVHFRPIDGKDVSYTFPNIWLEPFRKQTGGMGGPPPMGGSVPPPPGGMM
jgi:hypothetical protein